MRKLLTRPKKVAVIRIAQWCSFIYISGIFSFWEDSAKVTGVMGFAYRKTKRAELA